MKIKWRLESGEVQADKYGTFQIPSFEARTSLRKGMYVKAIFSFDDGQRERMWIEVLNNNTDGYVGTLLSTPATVDERILAQGAQILFGPQHVIDIDDPENP